VTEVVFGSMFVSMGEAVSNDLEAVGLGDLYKMFEKALDISMKIGKGASPGEKIMVDSLYPAVESLKKSIKDNKVLKDALKAMSEVALKGAVSTKEMIATKGRARYLGKRSLGMQDPGATSIAIIIEAFCSIF
jgi:dihydroxyacetone kinase-like protein